MKTPTNTVSFAEEGYTTNDGEPLWLKVPRSINEGEVHDIMELQRKSAGDLASLDPEDIRNLNMMVLMFVTEWNFDDENGKPMPPIRNVHGKYPENAPAEEAAEADRAARIPITSSIPLEVIQKVTRAITGQQVDKSNP